MFPNRESAAAQLAGLLKDRNFADPLVVAIPLGGVITGSILAEMLDADFDVMLVRRIVLPNAPDQTLGAVCEDGEVFMDPSFNNIDRWKDYFVREAQRQLAEIASARRQVASVCPRAPIQGRSILLADDGIASGSTMIAALRALRTQRPHELIVAVPVGGTDKLAEVRRYCDEIVCLRPTARQAAVRDYYDNFEAVSLDEVSERLQRGAKRSSSRHPAPSQRAGGAAS